NAAREFRPSAQDFVEFLDFLVQGGGAFEVQLFAGFLALVLDRRAERASARFEELHETLHFDFVLLFGATRKTGREAHFHFGIEAAGKRGIAADFNLATPHFEQIEDALGECLRRAPRGEWAVIRASRGRAALVDGNAASHKTTR